MESAACDLERQFKRLQQSKEKRLFIVVPSMERCTQIRNHTVANQDYGAPLFHCELIPWETF
jgi:hypothetical protein